MVTIAVQTSTNIPGPAHAKVSRNEGAEDPTNDRAEAVRTLAGTLSSNPLPAHETNDDRLYHVGRNDAGQRSERHVALGLAPCAAHEDVVSPACVLVASIEVAEAGEQEVEEWVRVWVGLKVVEGNAGGTQNNGAENVRGCTDLEAM